MVVTDAIRMSAYVMGGLHDCLGPLAAGRGSATSDEPLGDVSVLGPMAQVADRNTRRRPGDVAILGRALARRPANGVNRCLERSGIHLLSVYPAGGPSDRFIHQDAADVLGASLQCYERPIPPKLDP
jgi:hypothetical protein